MTANVTSCILHQQNSPIVHSSPRAQTQVPTRLRSHHRADACEEEGCAYAGPWQDHAPGRWLPHDEMRLLPLAARMPARNEKVAPCARRLPTRCGLKTGSAHANIICAPQGPAGTSGMPAATRHARTSHSCRRTCMGGNRCARLPGWQVAAPRASPPR